MGGILKKLSNLCIYIFPKQSQLISGLSSFFTTLYELPSLMSHYENHGGFRSSHPRCSVKKDVLFCHLQLYLKRDSGTGVFLWILRHFQEHWFNRAPLDDCFSTFSMYVFSSVTNYSLIAVRPLVPIKAITFIVLK